MRRRYRAVAWLVMGLCTAVTAPVVSGGAAGAGSVAGPGGITAMSVGLPGNAGVAVASGAANGSSRTTAVGIEAWIYPGVPGQATCSAPAELASLPPHSLAAVKPQYLEVMSNGRVSVVTAHQMPCNGFRSSSLHRLDVPARHVIVTVAASSPGVGALLATQGSRMAAQQAIVNFVTVHGFDGAELDFAPHGWSTGTWGSYMALVFGLAGALHASGRELEVDLPAWTATPPDAERYAGPVLAGARLVVMAFDHQYTQACGPIAPYAWIRQVVRYVRSQVPLSDVTVGIPSYGYIARSCTSPGAVQDNVPYVTMEQEPGFPSTPQAVAAHRDRTSGEIRWKNGQVQYDYVDASALRAKLWLIGSLGVTEVSVWSLGGNPWFTHNP